MDTQQGTEVTIELDAFQKEEAERKAYEEAYKQELADYEGRDIVHKMLDKNARELGENLLDLALHSKSEKIRLQATTWAIDHMTSEEKDKDALSSMLERMARTPEPDELENPYAPQNNQTVEEELSEFTDSLVEQLPYTNE